MNKNEALLKDIRERLSDFRYIHSLGVAESAGYLAEKYGYDKETAITAGLAHDVLKELSREEYLKLFETENIILSDVEKSAPKLWHAMAGAEYLRREYGFPEEIITAVRYHTTGREGMGLLEKILFIADFISADRNYNGVEDMRQRAEISLEYAMEEGLRFTIEELARGCKPIHPDTIACYNEIIVYLSQKGNKYE